MVVVVSMQTFTRFLYDVNKHLIDFEASLGYYSSEVFSFNNGGFTCH